MTDPGVFRPLMLLIPLLLVACATSPVATESDPVLPLGPAHVLEGQSQEGDRVIWGGRIVAVRNLANRTEISVVSYPLDRADRPRLDEEPGVRFLVRRPGFLEPVKYAPGRFVTVLGTVVGIEHAEVDEYRLAHPVLAAERVHLWPAEASRWQSRTQFSIGLGISL
ncbi:Slp family lipoprotein [Wenzhouxiangella limi]|uniref:Slp family lipoprotein n=1 Tax=Wenzhouxiangella limi TaxID=2707351 RepID=UPI0030B84805